MGLTLGRSISSCGTFWKRAASGLNSGVSINWRKRFAKRLRRPVNEASERPRLSMSASRSMSSTTSRVKLQSNSFTVHLTWSNTSSRSSIVSSGKRRPLYNSINSLARVVKGVCTCATSPSLICQRLGADMSCNVERIRLSRFSSSACKRRRSIVCSSFCSLRSNCCRAARRSASSNISSSLMRFVSCTRHASSSLYRISKSAYVCGCMRRWISTLCRSSASALCASSSAAAAAAAAACARRKLWAAVRANQPRVYRCKSIAFSKRSSARSSEVKYGSGRSTVSPSSSIKCPRGICVPASRTACWDRVCSTAVCVSR
mmetsp:Transcript_76675/g.151979  ORF Transcript_76675/g.151979 Transcript_76675/m.151979 type:complete len:317 (-) Transcript_76675:553-1503(-)